MTAIEHIKDAWLEQEDVWSRVEDSSIPDWEWLTAFEVRDSYVEHFRAFFLPVRQGWSIKTLHEPSWGCDFDHSDGQIAKVRRKHTHYLGLRFRRFLGLNLAADSYFQNGKLIAQRKVHDGDTLKSDTISVRREAVLDFVRGTKQLLLWCVRSQRYSERELTEFGLEAKSDWRRQEHYHYVFERMPLKGIQKNERPRMATMTQVFGKGLVRLTNV